MDKPVIQLTDVRRYYLVGDYLVKALDGVTLSIPKGSFTAIMGPSGSGKSTMMNLIGCLDTPTSGYITIGGEMTNGMSEAELAYLRNEKIGFKIREHTLRRVPYMLVCGDKEVESGKVAVRTRRGKDLGSMDVNEVIEKLQQEIRSRSLKQLEE